MPHRLTNLLFFAVDNHEVCTFLKAVSSALFPASLCGRHVIETTSEIVPSLLSVVVQKKSSKDHYKWFSGFIFNFVSTYQGHPESSEVHLSLQLGFLKWLQYLKQNFLQGHIMECQCQKHKNKQTTVSLRPVCLKAFRRSDHYSL